MPEALADPRSPRIIELLGLPGSGKSTLAQELLTGTARGGRAMVEPRRILGTGRIPLPTPVDAALRAGVDRLPVRAAALARRGLWRADATDPLAVLARTHPEFLELVAHAPAPPDADAEEVLNWRSWPTSTLRTHVALRRTAAPGRTVLVEEGVVQRANTVCAGDRQLAPAYFATQPLPDALVVLHIDPRSAQQRIAARDKRMLLRHVGRRDEEVLEDLRRTADLIGTAVEVLRSRGLEVVELDGAAATHEQAEQVRVLAEGP